MIEENILNLIDEAYPIENKLTNPANEILAKKIHALYVEYEKKQVAILYKQIEKYLPQ